MNHLYKLLLIIMPILMYSHSLLLNISDNGDGTILVSGSLDTGQSAEGVLVRIESILSKDTLYLKRLPSENKLIIKIPDEPYKVILEDIDGDQVEKKGIPPKGGFSKKKVKKTEVKKTTKTESNSFAIIASILLAFVLLFITIYVNIHNTRKLMREIKNK